MKVKEESEKVGLNLNIQIMASGPITSWRIGGKIVETVADFIFLGSKITADSDCIHEVKRCVLLGRKAMTNLGDIKKQRHCFADKGLSSQSYGFSSSPVWTWELDYKKSWVPKNWCFWTVVLEKTWESVGLQGIPTSPSLRQSVLNIHWKDWCWSWNSNTLVTRYKKLTHWQRPWCWERLKVGGKGDNRGWDGWLTSPTRWTWVWVSSGSWWWTWWPGMLQSLGSQSCSYTTEQLNWTEKMRNASLLFIIIYTWSRFSFFFNCF